MRKLIIFGVLATTCMLISTLSYSNDFPMPDSYRVMAGLELEKTDKKILFDIIGIAHELPKKDEHHDSTVYCYKSVASSRIVYLYVEFGFEYFNVVNEYSIREEIRDPNDICTEITLSAEKFVTGEGLRLGLTKDEVRKYVPGLYTIRNGIYYYGYSSYLPFDKPQEAKYKNIKLLGESISEQIWVSFDQGKAIAFGVSAYRELAW